MKPVKLHKPLLDAVRNGLANIFLNGSYADKEVQKILRTNKQYGSKDRSFIAETIYDIVRWMRNYQSFIRQGEIIDDPHKINFNNIILLSLFNRKYELMNPELLEIDIEESDLHVSHINLDARLSFPTWLDERCYKELGKEWNDISTALNIPAKIFIRANTLRTSTEKLLNLLKKEGVEGTVIDTSLSRNSIEIFSKNNLKNSKLYKEGLFEFQDLGSQAIGEFCEVKEKQTVLDLCAGAGGKSLHLSALMKNTGKIYVTDYNAHRLESVHLRARQAGCRNIEIIQFDQAKKLKDIDLLLTDAPCSGLGTIRRHPDIKWKLKEEDISRFIHVQSELLETYKNVIHKDGKIVYATCSILPSESEEQVKKFIEKNPAFKLKEQKRIHPHIDGCDGFYMASIVRS